MVLIRRCPVSCFLLSGLCLLGLMLAAGCSGATSAGAEAAGTVTLDGTPLPNAFISFIPKGEGSSAFATSDGNGSFTVQTSGSVTGLAPGEYLVVVEQGDAPDGESAAAEGEQAASEGEVSGASSIPAKYRSEKTTDLSVTVSEGESKSLTLELSSAE